MGPGLCTGKWGDAKSSRQPTAGHLALSTVLLWEQLWSSTELSAPAASRSPRTATGGVTEALLLALAY